MLLKCCVETSEGMRLASCDVDLSYICFAGIQDISETVRGVDQQDPPPVLPYLWIYTPLSYVIATRSRLSKASSIRLLINTCTPSKRLRVIDPLAMLTHAHHRHLGRWKPTKFIFMPIVVYPANMIWEAHIERQTAKVKQRTILTLSLSPLPGGEAIESASQAGSGLC